MLDLTCPKCKSENTQKLSSIVDGGTSHSQSHSVGSVGGSIGGSPSYGVTSSTTNTRTQSMLAKKLGAPAKKPTFLLILGFGFLMLVVWGMFGKFVGLLLAAGLGFLAYTLFTKNTAYNTAVLPGLLEEWNASFYCHRCENVFKGLTATGA